ncbi:S8 family peptidase [Pseudomonas aeruginosa]|uniref:S8 family peptidase n=1 Tax=Pseudomonas aeruginosa TaxID=287 RepID=UPI003FD46B0D
MGLTSGQDSAWNLLGDNPQPVVVAVIDTGLDWHHQDFNWNNLWRNAGEIPDNGIDDDNNGYVDDVIGWDFFANSNKPWDHDGHGTLVAGIVAADTGNGTGMAGINPHARIMVLKALNSFGHTRASYLAKAIVYAVDNGARIINMSVGGQELGTIEREAIDHAISKGVLVVVAAGNEGVEVSNYGIAGLGGVLTVAATDLNDKRAAFSNWGTPIDIAAPGVEVLGLRARRTDTMRDIAGVEYVNGANYVGGDKRYYRASGTSFAAPIVAGVASLLFSQDPSLTAVEVKRMLLNSARDIETPGRDNLSGWGLVDARAALKADREYFIAAAISGVEVVPGADGQPQVQVLGTADANRIKSFVVELGAGEEPASFKKGSSPQASAVVDGVVGVIPAAELAGSTVWILRLTVEHADGSSRETRFRLQLGG